MLSFVSDSQAYASNKIHKNKIHLIVPDSKFSLLYLRIAGYIAQRKQFQVVPLFIKAICCYNQADCTKLALEC